MQAAFMYALSHGAFRSPKRALDDKLMFAVNYKPTEEAVYMVHKAARHSLRLSSTGKQADWRPGTRATDANAAGTERKVRTSILTFDKLFYLCYFLLIAPTNPVF